MIRKTKIRSLKPYQRLLPQTADLYVGVVDPSAAKLKRIGFSNELADGETVLPSRIGRISRYNAEGKNIINMSQPLEVVTHTREWEHKEWHGRNQVDVTSFVDFHYNRRPRTHVEPPALELTLYTDTKGRRTVTTPKMADWRQNQTALLHAINLMLELFGECQFYDGQREQVIDAPMHRLNWKLLPKGEMPYPELREQLKPALDRVKKSDKSFVEHRLERINSYKPEFAAVGLGGFTGYIVFAFPDKQIFLLESMIYGNATYVLGTDWEHVSKMTKAEILQNELHKERIVHLSNWFAKIRKLLDAELR
jgi:hypothetical protein